MTSTKFSPPWKDVRSDGTLGPEHGPKTMGAFARQNARTRDWSYQPTKPETVADVVHTFMRTESDSAPVSEQKVYADVFCDGYSHAEAAEFRGISASSIKCYVRRLRDRAKAWAKEQASDE